MNFLADESIDQPIVDELRRQGHQVGAVAEISPSISDDEVLDFLVYLPNKRRSLL